MGASPNAMWWVRVVCLAAVSCGAWTLAGTMRAPLPDAYQLVFSSLPEAFIGAFLLGLGSGAWLVAEAMTRNGRSSRAATRWRYVQRRRCPRCGWSELR